MDEGSAIRGSGESQRVIPAQEALKEVNHAVLTLGLEDCLQVITEQATLRLGAAAAVVLLRDDDSLRVAAWKGVGGTLPSLATDARSSLGSWIIQTGTLLVIDDLRQELPPAPCHLFLADCRSLMAAPLVLQNRPVGAFILEALEPHAFHGAARPLFELFTQQANCALLHSHLVTDANRRQVELRKANRLRDVLEQANRVMLEAGSEAELFAGLCRTIRETGGLRGAWFGRLEADGRTVRVLTPVGGGTDHGCQGLDSLDPECSCLAARAARLGRMQVEHEYDFAQCGALCLRESTQSNVGSVACLPVEFTEGSRGVLAIYASDPRYFSERECATLQALARALPAACRGVRERVSARAAQAELRRLQTALDQAIQAGETGVWEWEATRGRLDWRGAHAAVFGLQPGVTEGVTELSRAAVRAEDQPALRQVFEQARRTVAAYQHDYRVVDTNGGNRWFRERGRFLPEATGATSAVLGSVREVTLEKELARKLQCQLDQVRDLEQCLNLAGEAVAVADADARITFWNTAAEQLFHLESAQARGRDLVEVLLGRPGLPADLHAALQEQGQWSGEFPSPVRNGGEHTLLSRWTVITGSHVERAGLLVHLQDITDRKRLAAELRRSQRLESIGTIARGIAHDLNNALTPLLMAGELIRSGLSPDEAGPFLEVIEQNGQRAADIVRQLQSLARGTEGERITIQMRHLVRGVLRILKDDQSGSAKVEARLPADLWTVHGDPVQLQQVLLNLCAQAARAVPDGGTLVIQVANRWRNQAAPEESPGTRPGAFLVFTFGQTDGATGRSREAGSGRSRLDLTAESAPLGSDSMLDYARATIREHGGFLRVTEECGQAFQMEAWLPAQADVAPAAGPAVPDKMVAGNGRAVLVAEDDATVRTMIQAVLEAHGYAVHTAVDGADALAVFVRHRSVIEVVVTDAVLPVVDGELLVRTLKRLDPDLRIIVCATDTVGAASRQRLERFNAVGVAAIIPKPFAIQDLLAFVAADAGSAHPSGSQTS